MKTCFISFLNRDAVTVEVPGHGRVTLRGLGLRDGVGIFDASGKRINPASKVWAIEREGALKPMLDEFAAETRGSRFGIDRMMLFVGVAWWGTICTAESTFERARELARRYDYRTLSNSDPEAFLVMAAYVCSKCREDWAFLRESLQRTPTQRVVLHEAMVWFRNFEHGSGPPNSQACTDVSHDRPMT